MKISLIGKSDLFDKTNNDILKIDIPEDRNEEIEVDKAVNHSDFLFIFTEDTLNGDGSYNHGKINRVIKSLTKLADNSGVNNDKKNIIICSTTMPGYITSIKDFMEKLNYTVTYNPIHNHKFILIGETDSKIADKLQSFYKEMYKNVKVNILDSYSAEMYKLIMGTMVANKTYFQKYLNSLIQASSQDEDIFSNIQQEGYFGNYDFDNKALGFFTNKIGLKEINDE
jgi:UDP-glucose 6-dehydrogenase